MKRKLYGLLVDVEHGVVEEKEIRDSLEDFYHILNCGTIDIVNRKIGNRRYEIVCDDEALLKSGCVPSAINDYNEAMLLGNIFIVNGTDEDGNLTSLSQTAIATLNKHIAYISTKNRSTPFPIIKNMNY